MTKDERGKRKEENSSPSADTNREFVGRGSVELRYRTKSYALRIINLFEALPKRGASQVIGKQLLRSGTSVGAQYREACRAKSELDFVSKVEGSVQELDESQYWLELLVATKIIEEKKLQGLMQETEELIKIFVATTGKVKATITQRKAK